MNFKTKYLSLSSVSLIIYSLNIFSDQFYYPNISLLITNVNSFIPISALSYALSLYPFTIVSKADKWKHYFLK